MGSDAERPGGSFGSEDSSPLSQRLAAIDSIRPPPALLSEADLVNLARQRVGSTLRGWRLAHLLGTGPLSASYEAFRGPGDGGERGVLKLMLDPIFSHDRARSLVVRGAYAANRFQHPRVMGVVADGLSAEGLPFLVRPWADARPLFEIVRQGKLDELSVLRIAEQILDAVEIAHAHGVLHGAIHPANVLVTERHSIRLVDFSVPPGVGPRTPERDAIGPRRINEFTPPERCIEPIAAPSEQSDIFSIAACMYYAISGQFARAQAASPTELATTRPRPLEQVAPGVSAPFAMIVNHALAQAPEDRYESAYAMLGDVRRVLAGRKPKLTEAHRPVPSGSLSDLTPHSRSFPMFVPQDRPISGRPPAQASAQWKGNLLLILAIAFLAGLATFVLVRERVEEERHGNMHETR